MRELGRLIGRGKEAEVHEEGEHALKLYRSADRKLAAFREATVLAALEDAGVAAPKVFGIENRQGRWGVLMERVRGPAWAEKMRADERTIEPCLKAMARLHVDIHGRTAAALPRQRARLTRDIARTPLLGEPLRRRLLDGLAERPDGDRLCHGDFHPLNILGELEAPTVVDWLDASLGVPAADACRSYMLLARGWPDLADAYADAYARTAGIGRSEIDGWLPFVAAARLAEDVPEETEALVAMAERV
ncbi:hypothetical protein VE25_03745 [Devosia geojensis]|uniref:Aminoglycoside phosphotransferase domain-containing protein n=1 Tax=Devosia geojensis TaxID=443610 RepID=A0A0F5FX03_9HYPH|nr:phosphotransferase [Devosia geojensis]KKB13075.1 hypothetical protein VE25_03745 [Devosia geojensis]